MKLKIWVYFLAYYTEGKHCHLIVNYRIYTRFKGILRKIAGACLLFVVSLHLNYK